MILVSGLTRRYAKRVALDDVSIEIQAGEFVALMGPNGAGKSTLVRVVAGLARADAGSVTVGGARVARDHRARATIGVLGHESYLYGSLSAHENLVLSARLHALDDPAGRATRALRSVGMVWAADLPVEMMSRGMEQRVALARALLHEPRVLLLDEPFTGLDAGGQRFLEDELSRLRARNRTALLVTHDAGRAVRIATRAIVLVNGRVALDERLGDEGASAGFPARYAALLERGENGA